MDGFISASLALLILAKDWICATNEELFDIDFF